MYDRFTAKEPLIWRIGTLYKNLYDNTCYTLHIYIYQIIRNIKRRAITITIYFIKVTFRTTNVSFKKMKVCVKKKNRNVIFTHYTPLLPLHFKWISTFRNDQKYCKNKMKLIIRIGVQYKITQLGINDKKKP